MVNLLPSQNPPYSILDPDGLLAEGRDCPFTPEGLLEAHRWMIHSRLVDDLLVGVQRQGRSNVHAPALGQEAAIVGSAMAADPSKDWIVPQYREVAAVLRHGLPQEALWLHKLGVTRLDTVDASVRVLPMQISIGSQIPQGVGIAWGMQLQGEDGVVLDYFGDGAASEGDFHEGCNLAGVVRAPVVLFCQNNGWAISAPMEKQTAASSIADRAAGYGMPGVRVDGNDLFAVYEVTVEAFERARRGDGPTLIEAVTYRRGMHNTADDPSKYMDAQVLGEWEQRDPLVRLERYMESEGILDRAEIDANTASDKAELERTWKEAEGKARSASPIGMIFDHVYANPPQRQLAQRREAEEAARA